MNIIGHGKITVLLADDHTLVREGLRLVLESEKDIQVIAEAQNGREAVEIVKKLKPDVVVMDIAMPLLNGFEATRQIVKMFPKTKVLILSAYNDDEYVTRMIETGAAGYLIKQNSAQVLSKAIRAIKKDSVFFCAYVEKRLKNTNKERIGRGGVLKKKSARLSLRESEVLQLIAEGKANKGMADELKISIKTVEKHRQNLMKKLDIHDTAGLTRYAIASGVIESSIHRTIQ